MHVIETERLILRTWQDSDAEPYFQINQDPRVIEFLMGPMSMEKVHAFIKGANDHHEKLGYTLWAAELKATGALIGFVGLNFLDWDTPFTPAIEIGWRLGSQFWGCGYATEAAKACLDYGFNKCDLTEIIALTVPDNKRSIHVMEKLGMKRDLESDFTHPKVPPDHRLSHHILYRFAKDAA